MAITIQCFEEYGTPSSGRGTSIDLGDITTHPELGNWNLKVSPNPLDLYYPTQDSSGYALQRPVDAGALVFSYKKYLYFKVSGTYAAKLKDVRIQLSTDSASQAQKYNLFYKRTNTYTAPTATFDGSMICAGSAPDLWIHPGIGSSPILATSRATTYGPNETFYTQWLVLQVAATASTWSDVGNTAEFKLRLSFKEVM